MIRIPKIVGILVAIPCAALAVWLVVFQIKLWSGPPIPELEQDLPGTFAEAQLLFSQRLQERFPIGTRERNVIDTLREQGFAISADHKTATFHQPSLFRKFVWNISWDTDVTGAINRILGTHGAICL